MFLIHGDLNSRNVVYSDVLQPLHTSFSKTKKKSLDLVIMIPWDERATVDVQKWDPGSTLPNYDT